MIINSLLDTDYYKFTMAQFAFKYQKNAIVRYEFKNRRPNQRLADVILLDELKSELQNIQKLKFTEHEINFLSNQNIFSMNFMRFLESVGRDVFLPDVNVEIKDGQFEIWVEGLWPLAILWETFILSVINNLWFRRKKQNDIDLGVRNLYAKIEILKQHPQIKFVEFGTRRRNSTPWQQFCLHRLINEIPNQLIGTSNCRLAKIYEIPVFGTFAHELPMICAGVIGEYGDDALLGAQNAVFDRWYELYGNALSIALTDTFTTEHTLATFGQKRAKIWNGFRQDSGDPFKVGRRIIEKYREWGVDPKTKTIIFSDDLNVTKMVNLYKEFGDQINVLFGWGTNLTNDLGAQPLSIVVKATEVNGIPIVKISDDPIKISGNSNAVQRYKKIFGIQQ